jgi:integrase
VGRHPVLSAEQARQRAALIIARIKAGEDPVPLPLPAKHAGGPTVADLAGRYLKEHVAVRCKPKTQRTARSVVNRHIVPTLGRLPLQAVERRHVMAMHESLCETPAMANMAVETLTYMYKLAKGWDMVPEDLVDPCRSIPMNPRLKRERFLTDAEFTRLGQVLDEVSNNGSQISAGAVTTIRLLMLTGCRKSEIMTLRWQHVDLDRAEMRIVDGKTGDRTVHLSPSAVGVLKALPRKSDNPWVVPGAKPDTHMTDIDGAWQSIRARAGLNDVRIHDIRHSFASRALALGEGLPIIGRLLGHRRVETTARYAHLARDSVRESAERIASSIAEDIL